MCPPEACILQVKGHVVVPSQRGTKSLSQTFNWTVLSAGGMTCVNQEMAFWSFFVNTCWPVNLNTYYSILYIYKK